MLTKICINTLAGLPASGKSTFCQKIQCEAQTFNVIHICYDDFIRMPSTDHSLAAKSHYFQSKQYKTDRFSLLWLIQQLIDDIKQNADLSKFRLAMLTDFSHVKFNVKFEPGKDLYLLLIDDTMHYKSMRKEVRTVARDNELGFFVNLDDDETITTDFVELFALNCVKAPLKLVELVNDPVVEQTMIHKADLVLRQCVNRKMKNYKQTDHTVDLGKLEDTLCAKRCFVLKEIKLGRIDLPVNLNDLCNFID